MLATFEGIVHCEFLREVVALTHLKLLSLITFPHFTSQEESSLMFQ